MMQAKTQARRYTLTFALTGLSLLLITLWIQGDAWRAKRIAEMQQLSPPTLDSTIPELALSHLTQAVTPVVMVERPLFTPTRTPANNTTDVAPTDVDLARFMLTSIVITPKESVAFFQHRERVDEVFGYRAGDRLGTWHIKHIDLERVKLVREDGVSHTFDLKPSWVQ